MKKMIIISLFLILSLTACTNKVAAPVPEFEEEYYIPNKVNSQTNDKINKTEEVEEIISDTEEISQNEFPITGTWINTEDNKIVIQMTDSLSFGYFPNIEINKYYIMGKMNIKKGTEALEELNIKDDEKEVNIMEGVTKENYYSIIVDIKKMIKNSEDVSENLNENSKVWYMMILLKNDSMYVYDANNDNGALYIRQK